MKGRNRDKDERRIVGDADATSARAGASRARERGGIREKLKRGELIIEFERDDPADTVH